MVVGFLKSFVGSNARRNPAGFTVRAGRFLYGASAGFVAVSLYTGYRNQSNEGFLRGLKKGLDWSKSSKADAVSSGVGSAAGSIAEGVSDVAAGVNGTSQTEKFNQKHYEMRIRSLARVAQSFGCHFTSGVRTSSENAASNGVSNSLHLKENGALASDWSTGSGPISDGERRFYEWANGRSEFQEVLLHNSGSGWHVHIAFKPGIYEVKG